MNDVDAKPLILIVDDIPENIRVIGQTLKQNEISCRLALAESGEAALNSVKRRKPDLILLDIMLPGMTGLDVCRKLKADAETEDIPVIFLTAKAGDAAVSEGLEAGAVDYISKPFSPLELLARVKTQLRIHHSEARVKTQAHELRQLLHVLCHDLLNPLNAMSASLQLTEDAPVLVTHDDDLRGMFMLAMNNAINTIELTRQISALDQGKMRLDICPVSLLALIDQSQKILAHRFKEKDVMPEVDIAPDHVVFAETTTLINSVINNALTNAIKFSYRGGIICIHSHKKDDRIELIIRDYGMGMPQRLLNDLFDINKPTTRCGTEGEAGTGFGMVLMRKLMHAYGGDVTIQSWLIPDASSGKRSGTEVHLHFIAAQQSTC